MPWYKTGTVSVTANSTTVTGSGTAWIANAAAGMGFNAPNGVLFEIASVNSDTQLTLATSYNGSTASGQAYAIMPTQAYNAELAAQAAALITSYSGIATGAGAGRFGDGSAASPGVSFAADLDTGVFRNSSNELGISTAGVERVRVSSAGSVGIGTSSPNGRLHVDAGANNAWITVSSASTRAASLVFAGNGVTPWSAGTYMSHSPTSFSIVHVDNTPLVVAVAGSERARITTTGELLVGTTTATGTAKIQVSNGIRIGNTAVSDVNTLDYYEEGNWTPVVAGATTAGTGTYGFQSGRYTRIGNRVMFSCVASVSAHTGTGNLIITGLPFTSSSIGRQAVSIVSENLTYTGTLSAVVATSSTQILVQQQASNAALSAPSLAADTTFAVWVTGQYEAA